jgi:hypothetical protein
MERRSRLPTRAGLSVPEVDPSFSIDGLCRHIEHLRRPSGMNCHEDCAEPFHEDHTGKYSERIIFKVITKTVVSELSSR